MFAYHLHDETIMEPWYQMDGPKTDEVKNMLFKCLSKKYKQQDELKISVDKVVELEKTKYPDNPLPFGSWRGYHTFTHSSLIDAVKKEYSLQLIQPILKRWVNHLLYKAPDDDGKNAGLRYFDVMKSFNETKMANNS